MKQLQKKQHIKLCSRWFVFYLCMIIIFLAYQKVLADAYETNVISWIGQLEDEGSLKTVIYQPFEQEYYDRGSKILRNAGYEETGKEYLRQMITAYGRLVFFAGSLFLCIGGFLCEVYIRKRETKKTQALIEKECDAVYREIQGQKEFVQAERKKMGIYMENISHQLKTPIAGTLLTLEYLLETEDEQRKKERLEGCVKQVCWMSEMTTVLLRLAQIDAGKIWMKRKREDLVVLVENCIERVLPLANEKNLSVQENLDEKCILSCDAFWIKEAVENVLKNAIDFAPRNGFIRVSVKAVGKFYEIRIFNSGKKLDVKRRELVFERFSQTGVGKKEGFGIGLHLAREIADLHQGTLQILDTDEEGTAFQFLIPKLIAKDRSGRNLS